MHYSTLRSVSKSAADRGCFFAIGILPKTVKRMPHFLSFFWRESAEFRKWVNSSWARVEEKDGIWYNRSVDWLKTRLQACES